MKYSELLALRVGRRVVARDTRNRLRPGTVDPVPHSWRVDGCGPAWTTKGAFPKVWIRSAETGSVVPWPAEDVFSDIDEAEAAVADHAEATR